VLVLGTARLCMCPGGREWDARCRKV